MGFINNPDKTYIDLISDAYEYYLDNFIEPKCPETYDVQPDYYLPMDRERFEKTLFCEHARSVGRNGISEQYGVTIETRDLGEEERKNIWNKNNFSQDMSWHNMDEHDAMDLLNEDYIPTKLTIITHNGQTQESYE